MCRNEWIVENWSNIVTGNINTNDIPKEFKRIAYENVCPGSFDGVVVGYEDGTFSGYSWSSNTRSNPESGGYEIFRARSHCFSDMSWDYIVDREYCRKHMAYEDYSNMKNMTDREIIEACGLNWQSECIDYICE